MTDEEMERLARAATPGPWRWVNPENDEPWQPQDMRASLRTIAERPARHGDWSLPDFILDADDVRREEDAQFIAAFDPATALALLERVRKAEARVRELETKESNTKATWCEHLVQRWDGQIAGLCSLETGHDGGCEYWLGGRHPSPLPR